MSAPRYTLTKNELFMVCDTPEAEACAELIKRRDKDGGQFSDWWGHPSFGALPDGTMTIRLPANVRNMSLLHASGALPNRGDPATARRIAFFAAKDASGRVSPMPLKPFQQEGMRWLLSRDLCGILAFAPGLGKTLTTFAALREDPERFLPAVIIAPAHVKLNWRKEWKVWGGKESEMAVLFGRKPDPAALAGKRIVVLNQHILKEWADALVEFGPKTFVIDEAHAFVNSNTKTYPVAERVAKAAEGRVLLLTATPLVNNLGDLWGLANLICPDILGTKTVFSDTFMPEERAKQRVLACRWRGGFAMKDGWRAVARARLPKALKERRIEELREILHKTVILLKRKRDVIEELPQITEEHVRLDIGRNDEAGKAFWEVEDRCLEALDAANEDVLASDQLLPAIGLLRRNAAMTKVPYAADWLSDWLAETEESDKIVVIGWSKEPLSLLHGKFKRQSVLINGDVEARKKQALGAEFEADPHRRILFGNVKSIGTGIDLVAAATELFIELPLTDVDFQQTRGRIDRLSQKAKHLFYYYMTIEGSYEEKKGWKILRSKGALTESLGL